MRVVHNIEAWGRLTCTYIICNSINLIIWMDAVYEWNFIQCRLPHSRVSYQTATAALSYYWLVCLVFFLQRAESWETTE